MSSTVKVTLAACSHPGNVRSVNTDHYLIVELGRHQQTLATSLASSDLPGFFDERAYCMLVADGLGTAGAGAVASRIAISTFAHLAIHFGKWNVRVDGSAAAEISERAEMFYRRVHDAVVEGSRANPALSGMATSLTGAYSAGDHLFYVHVGHSRAYLFRDGDLTQFSSDQAVPDRTSETGRLAPVSLQIDELKHILTDAIGDQCSEPRVQVEHFRLWDGDIVLLCSDGLTDVVDDDTIADALALPREPDQQCQMLVDLALRAGAPDNVTALLAHYAIPKA